MAGEMSRLRSLEYYCGTACHGREKKAAAVSSGLGARSPRPMAEVEAVDALRFNTGMSELDRVLGGGAGKG